MSEDNKVQAGGFFAPVDATWPAPPSGEPVPRSRTDPGALRAVAMKLVAAADALDEASDALIRAEAEAQAVAKAVRDATAAFSTLRQSTRRPL